MNTNPSARSSLIWWIIASVAFLRLLYAIAFPLDLSGDEAYYWDWGRRLSWGYFSKPPLIAWLMALAGWLGGQTDTGIRIMAALLGTGSLLFCYLLTRQLWGRSAAFWAVLLTVASPDNVALNLILTIDAPLVFFWSGALFFFYNLIHNRRYVRLWWVLTTVFLGLGLLSKQMMLAFYPMAIAYLANQPETRPLLRHRSLISAALLSLSFLLPTLWWNATHEWITLAHTQHHFEGKSISLLGILSRAGEFLGSQIGLLSPVTAFAIALLGLQSMRSFRLLEAKARFLVIFSVPGLILVCLLLLRQGINANWPAVFYCGFFSLLGAAVAGSPGLPEHWRRHWPRWGIPAVATGVLFALFTAAIPFLLQWTERTGSKLDPLVRLQGWSELAHELQRYRELHQHTLTDPFLLTTGHRYTTSQLAFYLVDQPRVFRWPSEPGAVESQYEIWGFDPELQGRDALILASGDVPLLPESLYSHFVSVRQVDTLEITIGDQHSRSYSLYIAKSFQLR